MLVSHRPTFLHLAPPLVGFLATHPAVTPDHLASVNYVVVGAAPVGKALIDQVKNLPNCSNSKYIYRIYLILPHRPVPEEGAPRRLP